MTALPDLSFAWRCLIFYIIYFFVSNFHLFGKTKEGRGEDGKALLGEVSMIKYSASRAGKGGVGLLVSLHSVPHCCLASFIFIAAHSPTVAQKS